MSDFPQGADWWKATNGRWYPPPATGDRSPPQEFETAAVDAGQAKKAALWAGGIVAALILIGALMAGGGEKDSPRSSASRAEQDRFAAVIACQDFMEGRLRAPATAEHPRNTGQATRSGSEFTVRSYVDSENGFGAMLRTNYTCVIRLSGDTWRLVSLTTS